MAVEVVSAAGVVLVVVLEVMVLVAVVVAGAWVALEGEGEGATTKRRRRVRFFSSPAVYSATSPPSWLPTQGDEAPAHLQAIHATVRMCQVRYKPELNIGVDRAGYSEQIVWTDVSLPVQLCVEGFRYKRPELLCFAIVSYLHEQHNIIRIPVKVCARINIFDNNFARNAIKTDNLRGRYRKLQGL